VAVLPAPNRLQKLTRHCNTGIAVASKLVSNAILIRERNALLDHVENTTTAAVVLPVPVNSLRKGVGILVDVRHMHCSMY